MITFEQLRKSTGASLCVACGKCSTMCPLAAQEDFSARRIVGQELHQHEADRPVGVHRCLSCAACEQRCPQGVGISEFVRGLREALPQQGRRLPPHGGIFQSGARAQARSDAMPARPAWLSDEHRIRESGEIALFVGCLELFDLYFQDSLQLKTLEIARSAVTILNRLGIEPVIVSDERCCGHDLLWSGDREGFTELASSNARAFSERGVKHIVTTCAECCRSWRLDYPQANESYRPRVEHISEFLAERELPLASSEHSRLSYQDPCRLGRHLQVFEAPRKVLRGAEGVELIEMPRSGRDAQCCGTSGFIHCDAQSKQLQRERLQSAADTGAPILATACPKCLIHFRCALTEDRRCGIDTPSVEVEDFTVLVASMIEGNEETIESPASRKRELGAVR